MFNDHPARSTEYKVQAIEEAAQRDAAPHRTKNEHEACYSETEIAQLAEHGSMRYEQGDYNDAETVAARDVYEIVFRSVGRLPRHLALVRGARCRGNGSLGKY